MPNWTKEIQKAVTNYKSGDFEDIDEFKIYLLEILKKEALKECNKGVIINKIHCSLDLDFFYFVSDISSKMKYPEWDLEKIVLKDFFGNNVELPLKEASDLLEAYFLHIKNLRKQYFYAKLHIGWSNSLPELKEIV